MIEGDFNRDGNLDLAIPKAPTHNVPILLGDEAGRFRPRINIPVEEGPCMPAVTDFNLDGTPDLARSSRVSMKVAILIGEGNGGFSAPVYFGGIGSAASALGAGDFNRDGKLDLVVAVEVIEDFTINHVAVFLGDGNGGIDQRAYFPVGIGPRKIAAH
ncbi:MAG: VCBS repeat-containing protein [Acidobacteria bacterium]|nr:VCBS repeat-containing protein [Acidobacteriota bacterium]